jgi:glycine cleavage system H lipoate-binding protein
MIEIPAHEPAARFDLPGDRHYLIERHMWALMEDGIVTVGVAAPLRDVLHAAPELEWWAVERVDAGGVLATAQGRGGRTVVLASPVAGTLVEVNPLLERAAHTLLTQPYRHGWLARLKPARWDHDAAAMADGTDGALRYRATLDLSLMDGRDACFGAVLLPQPAAT